MGLWYNKMNDQLENISLQLSALNSKIKENTETRIDNKEDIDNKISIILELLQPEDKILVDERELSSLMDALVNYFDDLQRESLCGENKCELPKGTHNILNKIEKFNETYKEDKHKKQFNKMCNILSGDLDRTLH